MNVRMQLAGDVVERQELLNATQSVTVEGAADDGAWTVIASFSWNRGLEARAAGEGDLTLSDAAGGQCFGTLLRADVREPDDPEVDTAHVVHLEYEVDGGSGTLDGASGTVTLEGGFDDATFRFDCRLILDEPGS